jgi:tetratricopeptide (TPR) repeat protein
MLMLGIIKEIFIMIQKKYKEAVDFYKKALDIEQSLSLAWINRGNALCNLGRYYEAIECYNKAIEVNPSTSNDDAYLYRGESKYELEDYVGALEDFKKVSNEKFNAQKYMNIGLCYYELGLYEDAEQQYREAIKNDSELVEAYYNLAVLYSSDNKYDKAKRQLDTCLKINRNFGKARSARRRLEGSNQLDWYNWWFGDQKNRKNNLGIKQRLSLYLSTKKVLGGGLLALVLSLIVLSA